VSDLMIKREVRRYLKTSVCKVDPKMVCSIVRLFRMRYGDVDQKHIASITTKLINEY